MLGFPVVFWSLMIPSMVFAICTDTAMRIRVNDRLPEKEQFSWFNRNSWAVVQKYGELYPNSYLPLIAKCNFLFFTILGAAFTMNHLWKPD
jgi:hypothetical protein